MTRIKTLLVAGLLIVPVVALVAPSAAAATTPVGSIDGAWSIFDPDAASGAESEFVKLDGGILFFAYPDASGVCNVALSDDLGASWFIQHDPTTDVWDNECQASKLLTNGQNAVVAAPRNSDASLPRAYIYDTSLNTADLQSTWSGTGTCRPNAGVDHTGLGVVANDTGDWVVGNFVDDGSSDAVCLIGEQDGDNTFEEIVRSGATTFIDADGRGSIVYVGDNGNERIIAQQYDGDGFALTGVQFGSSATPNIYETNQVASLIGISQPSRMAWDGDTVHAIGETTTSDSLCNSGNDLIWARSTRTGIDNTTYFDTIDQSRIYLCQDGEGFSAINVAIGEDGGLYAMAISTERGLLYGSESSGSWTWRTIENPDAGSVTNYAFYPISPTNVTIMAVVDNDWYQFVGGAEEAGVFVADASLSVDNMLSFDVDETGNFGVYRSSSGSFQNVSSFQAQTMSQTGVVDADCNQFGGIYTIPEGDENPVIVYKDCDSGGAAQALKIRSSKLGEPIKPSACDESWCLDSIDASRLSRDNSDEVQWRNSPQYPANYAVLDDLGGDQAFKFAYGFADPTAGTVGVVSYVANNNLPDKSRSDEATIDSSSFPQVDGLCFEQSGGDDYVVGSTLNDKTRAWRVDYDPNEDLGNALGVSLDLVYASSSAVEAGIALSCAGAKAYVLTSPGALYVVDYVAGTESLLISGISTSNNGLAVSNDGDFLAYMDGSTANIYDVEAQAVVATATKPSGTFRGLDLDATAQNLWIGTSTNISRYEVFTSTTGDPVSTISGGEVVGNDQTADDLEGEDGDSGIDSPVFGGGSDDLTQAFGGSTVAANGFLAIITIVGMMAITCGGIFVVPEDRRRGFGLQSNSSTLAVCAIAGLVLGIVLSWMLGFLATSVIFVLVVLVIGGLGAWFWRGRSA